MLNDELVCSRLLVAGLVTHCGLTPRRNRGRTSDGGLAFTTAVRVVARVHDGTADCRADTHMTLLTCFTDLDILMLEVADLTDCRLAVEGNESYLAGGKSYLSGTVFLSHELSDSARASYELTALAGVKLDVVDKSTYGDIVYRKYVSGLDIRC